MRDHQSLTGAHGVVAALQAAGVRCIFSLSGNQIMPVYDALLGSGIRLVHVRHEASAVYTAEAWAQLTGEIGVALVTAGAGFGNALGALLSARASETPVLLLSGDSPREQDGMGAFQEIDQVAMAAPAVKSACRAGSADSVASDVAAAIRVALEGRQGPVHLALPVDVLTAPLEDAAEPAAEAARPASQPLADAEAAAVRDFLRGARHPLVLTGPALAPTRSGDGPARLQAALAAPVLNMKSPRGLSDASLGALVEVTRNADRILLLGKAADFTTGYLGADMGAPGAVFAMIDPEPAELARARDRVGARLQLAVQADPLPALQALLTRDPGSPDRSDWLAEADAAISRRVGPSETARGTLHPARIAAAVASRLARTPGAVLIVDGGEFGHWAHAIAHEAPRIVNGVAGAIGASTAYAVAASLARPGVPVFAMMGDGTAGFLLAEYETAVREGAPFVAVIGNDDTWNAEHQIQLRDYGPDRTHSCDLTPGTRYDLAAAGLGAHGEYVDTGDIAALEAALDRALASGLPACVNLRIPKVPAPVVAPPDDAAEPSH